MKRVFSVLLALSMMVLMVAFAEVGMAYSSSEKLELTCDSSSALKADGELTYSATNAFDSDLSTAWVEGIKGSGIGEYITVISDRPKALKGFSIYAGYGKSDDIYYKNGRIKELSIWADGRWFQTFALRDVQKWQDCTFDEPLVAYTIDFMIESVYPGNKYEDTCLSELFLNFE